MFEKIRLIRGDTSPQVKIEITDDVLDLILARAYSKDSEFAGEIAATVAVGPKP
jgi:hypothetical protein